MEKFEEIQILKCQKNNLPAKRGRGEAKGCVVRGKVIRITLGGV